MHRQHMQGASVSAQACGRSGGQHSESEGLISLPILIKVISATMRQTVAIKILEVDDMMARAQEKVDAIRQVKQKVGELKPIDEVVFAQNVLKYNPEWEHSLNG